MLAWLAGWYGLELLRVKLKKKFVMKWMQRLGMELNVYSECIQWLKWMETFIINFSICFRIHIIARPAPVRMNISNEYAYAER